MGTKKTNAQKSLENVVTEIEALGEEIRLKLHLAGMEANTLWTEKLEPRLFEARVHAREAKDASIAAVEETLEAFKEFSAEL
jgi:hypothetical protein